MIRLIILALGVFLLWLLFISKFERKQKILISVVTIAIAIAGLWFEQRGEAPKVGRVSAADLVSCGASATHSYRSNFDISFCLQNNATDGTVKRVELKFTALNCDQGECVELESRSKDVRMSLAPGSQQNLQENLSFERVSPEAESILWTVEAITAKAVY